MSGPRTVRRRVSIRTSSRAGKWRGVAHDDDVLVDLADVVVELYDVALHAAALLDERLHLLVHRLFLAVKLLLRLCTPLAFLDRAPSTTSFAGL